MDMEVMCSSRSGGLKMLWFLFLVRDDEKEGDEKMKMKILAPGLLPVRRVSSIFFFLLHEMVYS